MIREFLTDLRDYTLSTAWWNLRFNLGTWIGGFTHASRLEYGFDPFDSGDDLPRTIHPGDLVHNGETVTMGPEFYDEDIPVKENGYLGLDRPDDDDIWGAPI
jgi:hypothetical protein